MRADDFVAIASFATGVSAHAARSLLEAEGIECILDPSEPFAVALVSGGQGVRLLVPSRQRYRAQLLLDATDFSEGELQLLATGEPPAPEG